MSVGQKIKESRKKKGLTLATLASAVGRTAASLSELENDKLKGDPDAATLVKISEALGDRSILTYALLHNPICQKIIPRAFQPLNNIKTDPSAILSKLQEELEEAVEAVRILQRPFSHADPASTPAFKEVLFANLEQLLDVQRNVEEAFDKLKACGALTEEEHLEIHLRQQAKVERNGHHKPEMVN